MIPVPVLRNKLRVVDASIPKRPDLPEACSMAPNMYVFGAGTNDEPMIITGDFVRSTTHPGHEELGELLRGRYPDPYGGLVAIGGVEHSARLYIRDSVYDTGEEPNVNISLVVGAEEGPKFDDLKRLAVVRNGILLGAAEVAIRSANFDPHKTTIGGSFFPEESRPGIEYQDLEAVGLDAFAAQLAELPPPTRLTN